MWSKTKKHLDNLICDSLKDRVEFHCSNYRMHDGIGRIYITVDKKEVYNMCTLKRDYYRKPVEGTFSQVEFLEVVHDYFNLPIEQALRSNDTLTKILVVIDRRVGKRTLEKMKEAMKTEREEIVKLLFEIRCESEGISIHKILEKELPE